MLRILSGVASYQFISRPLFKRVERTIQKIRKVWNDGWGEGVSIESGVGEKK